MTLKCLQIKVKFTRHEQNNEKNETFKQMIFMMHVKFIEHSLSSNKTAFPKI